MIEVWDYATWIAFANEARDQDATWRQHELHARTNYRDQGDYDLGGEG